MASLRGSPALQPENKDKILIILSSFDDSDSIQAPGGVSATSFVEAYVLLTTASVNIVIATPKGLPPSLKFENEKSQQWVRSKPNLLSTVKALEDLRESDFVAVVIPSCLGGLQDLASSDSSCASFVSSMLKRKKPVCTIGYGASALLGAVKVKKGNSSTPALSQRSVTAPSNMEASRFDSFKTLGLQQIEDRLRDLGAKYTCGEPDQIHIVVDGLLVTAQNIQSTALAVQNMIWLWKQAQLAKVPKFDL